ncbi:PDZ domain-containing protein [Actinomadura oligospora]|uniref:PDZ domain-containing protein n=1 Tax=Actinomadura oligospora TaxID=111804 RepID=UPI001474A6FB|nr:PDZ domain-containing protein [Actinomadura oligospora]
MPTMKAPATHGRIAAKYHNDWGKGPRVMSVEKGSKTARSGLRVNDIIMKIDGRPCKTKAEMDAALSDKRAGNPVSVVVNRDGHNTAFNVTLDPA